MELQGLRRRHNQQKASLPDPERDLAICRLPSEALLARPSCAESSIDQSSEDNSAATQSLPRAAAADQAMTDQGFSSKLDLLPTAPERTEKALRKLLVEPFVTQAVKLMGQRRPFQLSLAEQAAAINKTMDETATWAVAELARLQVADPLTFMLPCLDKKGASRLAEGYLAGKQ